MALLATYANCGAASLAAAGLTCIVHGLPTTPDLALIFPITASLTPPNLSSRTATTVNINNGGPAINNELTAMVLHSVIR